MLLEQCEWTTCLAVSRSKTIIIKLCLTHLKTRINNTIFIQLIVKANVEIGFYFDIIQWTSV